MTVKLFFDFIKYTLLVFVFFTPVDSLSQERITIPVLKGEIKFDGVVDDAAWDNIGQLKMVMHTPTFGNEPTEKSEVMICYTN